MQPQRQPWHRACATLHAAQSMRQLQGQPQHTACGTVYAATPEATAVHCIQCICRHHAAAALIWEDDDALHAVSERGRRVVPTCAGTRSRSRKHAPPARPHSRPCCASALDPTAPSAERATVPTAHRWWAGASHGGNPQNTDGEQGRATGGTHRTPMVSRGGPQGGHGEQGHRGGQIGGDAGWWGWGRGQGHASTAHRAARTPAMHTVHCISCRTAPDLPPSTNSCISCRNAPGPPP